MGTIDPVPSLRKQERSDICPFDHSHFPQDNTLFHEFPGGDVLEHGDHLTAGRRGVDRPEQLLRHPVGAVERQPERVAAPRGASAAGAAVDREHDIPVKTIWRISEHQSPDAIELMRKGEIRLILNTPTQETGARRDGYMMRRLAVDLEIPFITTISSAKAVIEAIKSARDGELNVQSLGEYHKSKI